MLNSIHSSYKSFFGLVSFIGLTFLFIKYRINMTRKDALDRFSNLEGGKNFRIESVSFAPKIEYDDSNDLNSRAVSLLNSYINADRLRYLTSKKKRE